MSTHLVNICTPPLVPLGVLVAGWTDNTENKKI